MGEINSNCDITLEGYGATLSEINSYIGLKQMDNLPSLLNKQRSNAIVGIIEFKKFHQ